MIFLNKFLIFSCALIYLCACEPHQSETQAKYEPVSTQSKARRPHKPITKSMAKKPSVEFSSDKIIDRDRAHNFYQVRVMNQAPRECSAHQERNLLFMLDILEGSQSELDAKYKKMLDNNLYEKMMSNAVCQLVHPHDQFDIKAKKPKAGTKRIRKLPNLKKLVAENPDFAAYLPAKSKEYLNNIIEYQRFFNDNERKETEEFNKKNLRLLEPEVTEDNLSMDVTYLTVDNSGWLDNNAVLINLARLANSSEDILVPIAVNLNSVGDIAHAVSMIVERKDKKLKFYFMDPLNWKLSNTKSYEKTLYPLMRFFENKDYFKKSLIRSGYLSALQRIEEIARLQDDPEFSKKYLFFPFFDYLEILEKLNLLHDEFFKKYYKSPTCKLIKEVLDDATEVTTKRGENPIEETKHRRAQSELLSKFACEN